MKEEASEALARGGVLAPEVATPFLTVEIDSAIRNIERMAACFDGATALRPHIKAHKCRELATLQIRYGASGITAATVWEAKAMIEAGIDDVLIANEVTGSVKIELVAELARRASVRVGIDDAANVRSLSRAARQVGSELGVVIDVDIGLGRCGVRSAEEAAALARLTRRLHNVRLDGVMGYEGHCVGLGDRAERAACAEPAIARLLRAADAIGEGGAASIVVSAGGTCTYDITGKNDRVTEIQAGSYVLMDTAHETAAPGFGPALRLVASVLSRHEESIVLDAGRKTCGAEISAPRILYHESSFCFEAEEHSVFSVRPESRLRPGDRVQLVVGYSPVAVNLHPVLHVVQDEEIVDTWEVVARGPGWPNP